MSEPFDPDKFLAETEGFDPDAFLADSGPVRQDFSDAGTTARAMAPPGPESIAPAPYGPEDRPDERRPSAARGAFAALLQGPAFNWADEMAGMQAKQQAAIRNIGKPESEWEDPEEAYARARSSFRGAEEAFREENPVAGLGLTVLGSLAGMNPGAAAPALSTRVAGAAATGALAGTGAADEAEDMALGAAIGAPLGAGGQMLGETAGALFGRFLGYLGGKAGGRVAAAEAKAHELAAAKVAEEVAAAKGKLGSTTQEANRFVENLLRLESTGALSGDQAAQLATLRQTGVLPALEQKLAASMLEQVPGAAGRVDIARSAYEGLAARANEAAEEGAQQILSGAEARKQIGERVRRYLPTVVGSLQGAAAGGVAGAMVGGSPTEAIVGALAGAGLRPAIRAGQRMVAHPAVQRGMYAPIASAARAGSELAEPGAASALTALVRASMRPPSQGDMVEQLATQSPEALGPYGSVLRQAAASGTLPLAHWHLQQTDPQYRALLESLRKEQR